MIKVRDLHVRYGNFEAVRGVSFELKKGELLSIVGESGSGKSTVANALMGLKEISSGTITASKKSMQMIFQDAVGSLNPRMKVSAVLREALAHHDKSALNQNRIEELLETVGLSKAVLNQYPREMSGGQCQRVSIARALACRPEILIADEPVSALDVSVQARILNLFRELRSRLGLSIILIAHDLAVVKNISDRVCVMEKGLIVEEGDPAEIFKHPKHEYVKKLLSSVPRIVRF